MAKFLTVAKLNDAVTVTFEAESATQVKHSLAVLAGEAADIPDPAPEIPAVRRTVRSRKPADTPIVGAIGPEGVVTSAAVVPAPVADVPALTTIAEIADAIRNYARQPGVGVPGVAKLISEFKDVAGQPAKQVRDIAPSEFAAVSQRLAALRS